jgi:diacylglycerol O-acyltransferase
MQQRRRLGVQDALWLEMDRPNNLMVVDSVIWTAEPLDFGKVRDVIEERLLNRFPVFRSRAVQDDDGSWWWEPDQDFDFDNHVALVSLNKPNDPRALQDLVAAHRTEMLHHDRPLWQAIWVKRYRKGSAMILRSHHAIADGMRMVQLSMSLFDSTPEGGPILGPAVVQHAAHPHPPGQPLAQRVRSTAAGAAKTAGDAITGVVGGIVDAPRLLALLRRVRVRRPSPR